MDDPLAYDDVALSTLEETFKRLIKSRSGEMILIHVSDLSRDPDVRCLAALKKQDSVLMSLLPNIVKNFKHSST